MATISLYPFGQSFESKTFKALDEQEHNEHAQKYIRIKHVNDTIDKVSKWM